MTIAVSRKIIWPLFTALSFAGSFIAAKYTIIDLQPLTTAFLRYLIAFLALLALVSYHKPNPLKVASRDLFKLALLGLFGVVGYQFFFFASLKHTALINTSIINAFSPVITGLGAAIFIRERLSKANYLGIIIALSGVIILVSGGNINNLITLSFNYGDILMLCAVISWAVYALLIKTLLKTYSGYTLTLYAALFGMLELGVLCLIEDPITQIKAVSGLTIISVLYLGIVATAFGHFLYNLCIAEIGPTKTSSFVYSVVPIGVTGLVYLFFKDTITLAMALSVVFIIVGLNFMMRRKAKR
ncbi:MAG: DMT family transporter [candidate division Zixibacteria bacterium]|nr:DMT family transporter [candidate division Zixibacteria bacterium]